MHAFYHQVSASAQRVTTRRARGTRRTRRTRRTSRFQRRSRRPHPTTTRSSSRVVRSPPASAPLRARLGNRPALRGKRHSRPCPPLRLCIAPRLGPASSACVLLPAQVSRLRRLPFAAVAHSGYAVCPSRRCAYTAYALGMACWESDVRRAGRSLAAARTPLRQMGCCVSMLVHG